MRDVVSVAKPCNERAAVEALGGGCSSYLLHDDDWSPIVFSILYFLEDALDSTAPETRLLAATASGLLTMLAGAWAQLFHFQWNHSAMSMLFHWMALVMGAVEVEAD